MSTQQAVRQTRNDTRVSSEWFHRPDDQRFTDLHSMYSACVKSAQGSDTRIIDSDAVRVEASRQDNEAMKFLLPPENSAGLIIEAKASHWSFGQLCGLINAPAHYLRKLPASLAALNVQYGLVNNRAEKVKAYSTVNGSVHLRAITGPTYGRIHDYEVVDAVRKIAGNGIGDTHWKVPGEFGVALDEVTKANTTLYASDRDVFIFLADEENKIEIGVLPNGDPDLVSRGFYVWNSEVGSRSFGIATFLFRYACRNRIIWGQSDFHELTLRHSKMAPARFMREAAPALEQYSKADPMAMIRGINAAREAVVARDVDAGQEFLQKRGFTDSMSKKIVERVIQEEGKVPENVWDFVQGITAVARDIPHQDSRVDFERQASKLLKLAKG